MKRPTKITPTKVRTFTITLLGIAASAGCASVIAARPWATHTGRCWERMAKEGTLSKSWNIDRPVTITVCPTPAPEKPETITLVFTCGPDPFPIRLEEPYAHGRKTPLSFKEAVNNYSWLRMIAPFHRCSPGPDSEEVDAYIKKKHRAFYDAAIAEVKRVEAEDADSYKNDGKAKP